MPNKHHDSQRRCSEPHGTGHGRPICLSLFLARGQEVSGQAQLSVVVGPKGWSPPGAHNAAASHGVCLAPHLVLSCLRFGYLFGKRVGFALVCLG